MAMKVSAIVGLAIAALLVGILVPLGMNDLLAFTSTNATVQTIIATVVPIAAGVSLLMSFIGSSE